MSRTFRRLKDADYFLESRQDYNGKYYYNFNGKPSHIEDTLIDINFIMSYFRDGRGTKNNGNSKKRLKYFNNMIEKPYYNRELRRVYTYRDYNEYVFVPISRKVIRGFFL